MSKKPKPQTAAEAGPPKPGAPKPGAPKRMRDRIFDLLKADKQVRTCRDALASAREEVKQVRARLAEAELQRDDLLDEARDGLPLFGPGA